MYEIVTIGDLAPSTSTATETIAVYAAHLAPTRRDLVWSGVGILVGAAIGAALWKQRRR